MTSASDVRDLRSRAMAISYSRPDPSSPSEVAAASFGTSRRGFDPNEVREFLRTVAAEIARLQEREAFLERELHTAQRVVPNSVVLDDALVTRMLGEEATRVLQAARDGAAGIRTRAEEGAAALLRDAAEEAQRVREQAEMDAVRQRQAAAAEAEAEREAAKQHGRDMVNEARDYRERMLVELNRRRDLARQQIEALGRGRERLMQAFERARQVSVDVVAELTPLADDDDLELSLPTTAQLSEIRAAGPRPADAAATGATTGIAVGELRSGADVLDDDEPFELAAPVDLLDDPGDLEHFDLTSTIERLADVDLAVHAGGADDAADDAGGAEDADAGNDSDSEGADDDATVALAIDPSLVAEVEPGVDASEPHDDEPAGAVASPEPSPDAVPDAGLTDEDATVSLDIGRAPAEADHAQEEAADADLAPEEAVDADVVAPEEAAEADDSREPAPVVSLFRDGGWPAPSDAPAPTAASEPRSSVDELFAKLRASRTDQVARRASAPPTTEADVAPAHAGTPPDAEHGDASADEERSAPRRRLGVRAHAGGSTGSPCGPGLTVRPPRRGADAGHRRRSAPA